MIKESLVIMALVGCDCDAKVCEYIRTADTGWSSRAECEKDIAGHIVSQHENYPLVVAVCREDRPEALTALADPEPNRTAAEQVKQVAGDVMSAKAGGEVSSDSFGRITTLFRTVDGYVSVRETAGTLVKASRQARTALTRLATSVTPNWF